MTIQMPRIIPASECRGDLPEPYWTPEYVDVNGNITSNADDADIDAIVVHSMYPTPDDYTEEEALFWWRVTWEYHALTEDETRNKVPWGDGGYNYVIDPFGNIYEMRIGGPGVIAGHTYRYNRKTVGIGMMFSGEMTPAAYDALLGLCMWLCDRWDIDPTGWATINGWRELAIAGHRDYPGTTVCPGDGIYDELGHLRLDVKAYQDSMPAKPMTLDEYQVLASETAKHEQFNGHPPRIKWVLGLAAEAGALVDIFKKGYFHGHSIDMNDVLDTSGRVLLNLARIVQDSGLSLQNVAECNIANLGEKQE